jgi:spore coat protein U-like protein
MEYMKRAVLLALLLSSPKISVACSVTLAAPPASDISSLHLVSRTPQVKSLGSILENCTEPAGYIVTITSLNASMLSSATRGYPYQFSYDSGEAVSLATPFERVFATPSTGATKPISVLLPPRREALVGTYSDTIRIVISAR